MSGDAYHITSPSEDGDGGYRAMKEAIKMANISYDEVDYINAHGTSTVKGDEIELNAISKLFKHKISVSSIKSSIGISLVAGSVESIFSILSLNNGILLATLNLDNPIETNNIFNSKYIFGKKLLMHSVILLDLEEQILRYYLKVFKYIFIFFFILTSIYIFYLFNKKLY